MQVIITAVGPDHRGLADPIIHHVTGQGANIAEIQMYDHDEAALFAMLCRIELPAEQYTSTAAGDGRDRPAKRFVDSRVVARGAGQQTAAGDLHHVSARAGIGAVAGHSRWPCAGASGGDDRQSADVPSVAEQFGVDWQHIGDAQGNADDERLVGLCDQYDVDYIMLARYMRILSPAACWKYAGGRIINLHHGLLPSFPGMRPYHDAYSFRMLTYGATCHFIVPELDAGNQIIYQSTFTVPPGMKLDEIIRRGQEDNEPHCLVEGVRRVVTREVQLHFHRVVARR